MSAGPVRRNDPCPCGSGRRYKECHGRLESQAPAAPGANDALRAGLDAHQRGQRDEARRRYEEALAADPANAAATHYLGVLEWEARRYARADELMRRSIELDAGVPDFHGNLGLLQRDRDEPAAAERSFLAALALDPANGEAANNLGLLYKDLGRHREAIARFESAAARLPGRPEVLNNRGLSQQLLGDLDAALDSYGAALNADGARSERLRRFDADVAACEHADRIASPGEGQGERARIAGEAVALWRDGALRTPLENRAYVSLLRGSSRAAWSAFRWRHARLENAEQRQAAGRAAHRLALPDDLSGVAVEVLGEQGLGDTLFFLRWAPRLAARGARLALRADPRLERLLRPTGLIAEFLAPAAPEDASRLVVMAGDLPYLLGEDGAYPPSLALAPPPEALARVRARLPRRASGQRLVGITWRAGTPPPAGEKESAALFKRAPVEELAGALALPDVFVASVQRHPTPGETSAAVRVLGERFVDLSWVNEDLDEAMAAIACLDEYAGVSNTNFHLRAALGGGGRVLVPFPPEWRWLAAGATSPWFAAFTLYREDRERGWGEALERLRSDLQRR